MNFDMDVIKKFGHQHLEYRILKGDNTIFFIKVGQNGLIYGDNNLYLKLATNIHEKYGCTVIVSSNPFNGLDPLSNALEVIEEYVKKNKFLDYNIYYMGISNGGLIGTWYGSIYPQIKRMLLVNTPIISGYPETLQSLEDFSGEFITLVYGSLDKSFHNIHLLYPYLNEKIGLEIIHGVNHKFTDNEDTFLSLPDQFLFYDLPKLTK